MNRLVVRKQVVEDPKSFGIGLRRTRRTERTRENKTDDQRTGDQEGSSPEKPFLVPGLENLGPRSI